MGAPKVRLLCDVAAALSFTLYGVSASASSRFDGTWYVDMQRSSRPEVLQLTLAPDGTWTYFDGSYVSQLLPDGKVHREGTSANEDRAFQPDLQTLVIVSGIHGREKSRTTLSLSADGKTLSSRRQRLRWDGTEQESSTTFARATPGGNGLQGIWKGLPEPEVSKTADPQQTSAKPNRKLAWVIWTDADGTMTWFIPNTGETLRGKADGKQQRIQGPYFDGQTFAWKKQTSPNRLEFTAYIDGKPVEFAEETISTDGQTYTDVLWAPGHEDKKSVTVFTRQP